MELLQEEIADAYYILEIAKFVGLAILVFTGIYIIGRTMRKINERNNDISKPG